MGVPRKQYSREFKAEAVRLVTEQGLSIAQAARDLGINDNMLSRWKRELDSHGTQAFPGQGKPHDEELANLRREVEVLRREREILKKPWVSSRNTCSKIFLHPAASGGVCHSRNVPGAGSLRQRLLPLVHCSSKPTGTA